MQQTETAIVGGHHINIKSILDYIKENRPIGFRISYKYVVIPVLIIFFLLLGSSFIRAPKILEPEPNSTISRTPVFKFKVIKNVFYKDYEIKLRYSGSGEEIQTNVFEENAIVIVTTQAALKGQSKVELVVKINKGLGPLTLWSQTFTYKFTTTI